MCTVREKDCETKGKKALSFIVGEGDRKKGSWGGSLLGCVRGYYGERKKKWKTQKGIRIKFCSRTRRQKAMIMRWLIAFAFVAVNREMEGLTDRRGEKRLWLLQLDKETESKGHERPLCSCISFMVQHNGLVSAQIMELKFAACSSRYQRLNTTNVISKVDVNYGAKKKTWKN